MPPNVDEVNVVSVFVELGFHEGWSKAAQPSLETLFYHRDFSAARVDAEPRLLACPPAGNLLFTMSTFPHPAHFHNFVTVYILRVGNVCSEKKKLLGFETLAFGFVDVDYVCGMLKCVQLRICRVSKP